MFHGEHCVAMATAFEKKSKLSRRCLHGSIVSTREVLALFDNFHRSYSNIVFYCKGCVAMATAFEENSLMVYRHMLRAGPLTVI